MALQLSYKLSSNQPICHAAKLQEALTKLHHGVGNLSAPQRSQTLEEPAHGVMLVNQAFSSADEQAYAIPMCIRGQPCDAWESSNVCL